MILEIRAPKDTFFLRTPVFDSQRVSRRQEGPPLLSLSLALSYLLCFGQLKDCLGAQDREGGARPLLQQSARTAAYICMVETMVFDMMTCNSSICQQECGAECRCHCIIMQDHEIGSKKASKQTSRRINKEAQTKKKHKQRSTLN